MQLCYFAQEANLSDGIWAMLKRETPAIYYRMLLSLNILLFLLVCVI